MRIILYIPALDLGLVVFVIGILDELLLALLFDVKVSSVQNVGADGLRAARLACFQTLCERGVRGSRCGALLWGLYMHAVCLFVSMCENGLGPSIHPYIVDIACTGRY